MESWPFSFRHHLAQMAVRYTNCLKGHQGYVRAIAEINTNGLFVTSSSDKTVKVWHSEDGRCLNTFSNLVSSLVDVCVVDDESIIIVSGKSVTIREVPNGRIIASSVDFPYKILSVTMISATSALLCDSHRTLVKIKWSHGRVEIVIRKKLNFHLTMVDAFANTFVTCLTNSCAVLWDADSFSAIRTFCGHKNVVSSITYDDTYFITASHDETIRVYDINSAIHLKTIHTHKGWIRCVRKVTGSNIIVSGGDDKIIALHAIPSGECIAKYNIGMAIESIALLRNGSLAVAGSCPHEVRIMWIKELPIPETARSAEHSEALAVAVREAKRWRVAYNKLEERLSAALDRISKLERFSYSKSVKSDEHCCIDLERFRSGDKVFRLPCMHVHHVECLLPHLKRQTKPECPICRTPVLADDLNSLPVWEWEEQNDENPWGG